MPSNNKTAAKLKKDQGTATRNFVHHKLFAIFVIAAVAVVGLVGVTVSKANTVAPQVYLAPSSGSFKVGTMITVAVRESSNTTPINAAQVGLKYPADRLALRNIDYSGSPFGSSLTPTDQTAGTVLITQLAPSGSAYGDQLIANVTFEVIASGTVAVNFTASCVGSPVADCTGLSSEGGAIDITTSNASYTLQKQRGKSHK